MNDPLTARDWLVRRRGDRTAELDAIRSETLRALPASITWREFVVALFRPNRTVWGVLAAAWLVIAALHFTRAGSPHAPAAPAPSPEAFAAWLNQMQSHETFAHLDHPR